MPGSLTSNSIVSSEVEMSVTATGFWGWTSGRLALGRPAAIRRARQPRGTRPRPTGRCTSRPPVEPVVCLSSTSVSTAGWLSSGVDELAVGHLEDDPRARGGDLGERRRCCGRSRSSGRRSPCSTSRRTSAGAGCRGRTRSASARPARRAGRAGRSTGAVDSSSWLRKWYGRGGRGLEVQALHRADAAVGPERQQHQRHRRAVAVVLLLVLPHGPATAVAPGRGGPSSARCRGTRGRRPCPRSR